MSEEALEKETFNLMEIVHKCKNCSRSLIDQELATYNQYYTNKQGIKIKYIYHFMRCEECQYKHLKKRREDYKNKMMKSHEKIPDELET